MTPTPEALSAAAQVLKNMAWASSHLTDTTALSTVAAWLETQAPSTIADADRFNYLIDHHSYHYSVNYTEASPAESGIHFQWMQATPEQQHWNICDAIDVDIAHQAAVDAEAPESPDAE